MKGILYFSIAVIFALTSSLPVSTVPAAVPEAGNTFSCADVTEIPASSEASKNYYIPPIYLTFASTI